MSSLLDDRSARTPDVDELERIWAESPDAAPREEPDDAPLFADSDLPPGVRSVRQLVGWGWPATILLVLLAAPAGAEEVPRAGWVDPAGWTMLLLLPLGYFALATFPRLGFSLFAAAGALGLALGIDCRASAHHLSAWWIVETAAFGVLACAALAGLALLQRR